MSKEQYKPDSRLKNVTETEDASASKNAEKLVEVKKNDNAEDKDNKFLIHENPSDEQMHESTDDQQKDQMDEDSD